ncbi:unnamed protein product [Chondrus crispus]|uniref:Uncharacterized protein n=1 Tax=Chondrus crispus TaxID=2769 RepID=R7QJJ8_CHOCR|nr:unnamed protein product [Chondrus crispus]CDF38692.1 unnamed protein product [Chondrus crispus]|eukprot:XP_005718597.1 unnamed protein product [Chondrus crispus]
MSLLPVIVAGREQPPSTFADSCQLRRTPSDPHSHAFPPFVTQPETPTVHLPHSAKRCATSQVPLIRRANFTRQINPITTRPARAGPLLRPTSPRQTASITRGGRPTLYTCRAGASECAPHMSAVPACNAPAPRPAGNRSPNPLRCALGRESGEGGPDHVLQASNVE